MLRMKCPVCSHSSSEVAHFDDIHLFLCPECRHRFTDPTRLSHFQHYADEYYDKHSKNWNEVVPEDLFDFILSRVQKDGSTKSILELGCGRGNFLRYLEKSGNGFALSGVDLSQQSLGPNIAFYQGDILSFSPKTKFDAVVSLAVIEHVTDIHGFVKKCTEVLRPGGHLVLMTLDDTSTLYAIARFFRLFGYDVPFRQLYSRHHLHHFSSTSFVKLLELEGYAIDKVHRHNIPARSANIHVDNVVLRTILRLGVLATFIVGQLTGRTYLQTVFCTKKV